MVVLYSVTLLVSALLLFSVQPMVGKMILPKLGGSPSVWNTCMVFFQASLLAGYAYAHWTTSRWGVRRQAVFHLGLMMLPLAVLPIAFAEQAVPPATGNPSFWLLAQLALAAGLPFLLVSTSAPLLQKWFSSTGHTHSRDPYFLYATSNAGSFLALLGYPLLFEPRAGLAMQSRLWTAGYVLLIGLVAGCAVVLWRTGRAVGEDERLGSKPDSQPIAANVKIPLRRRLYWLILAAVPSSLMLGVTTHITTDVAAVPLFWVIPLALYLLSFVLVFARKEYLPQALMGRVMAYLVVLMPPLLLSSVVMMPQLVFAFHLLTFFVICMVCHGVLARNRPDAEHLTEFYLWMSLGGVLGGSLNALVAPAVLNSVAEYPAVLVLACLLRPATNPRDGRKVFDRRDLGAVAGLAALAVGCAFAARAVDSDSAILATVVAWGIPAFVCFVLKDRPVRFALAMAIVFLSLSLSADNRIGKPIFVQRSFFGVNRVRVDSEKGVHLLVNGHTMHGIQRMLPEPSLDPLAYYHRTGPVGDIFAAMAQDDSKRQVGIVGLGSGAIAAYARPGQQFTFYEIDPVVRRIATDPRYFTFLDQCRGDYKIVLGDARLQLAKEPDGRFDLLVLDAFSSDSIPTHLLTREALQTYCRKLRDDGVVVFHVSNRFLDLTPMLAQLARECRLVCYVRNDLDISAAEKAQGKAASTYVIMARRRSDLGDLPRDSDWSKVVADSGTRGWTDDYSDILGLLRW